MKRVQKANRVLKINDELLENYLRDGYCEIDNDGKVIGETKAETVKTLKTKLTKLISENESLKAQIADLSDPAK